MGLGSIFQWFGDKLKNAVLSDVNANLNLAGAKWLADSRARAPHKTGFLKAEEGYRVDPQTHTLILILGAPYDVYQEFGTRYLRARPHVRPALNAIGRLWGGNIEMLFNRAGPELWRGMFAHQGNFIVPSGIQPKPLTQRQLGHVKTHLAPVSAKLHRGNTKRARFRVKRFNP